MAAWVTGGPARSHDGDRSKNSSSTAQAEEVRQLRRSSSIRPGKEATEQGPAGGRSPLPRGGQNDGEIATQACDSGADSATPGTVRRRSRQRRVSQGWCYVVEASPVDSVAGKRRSGEKLGERGYRGERDHRREKKLFFFFFWNKILNLKFNKIISIHLNNK